MLTRLMTFVAVTGLLTASAQATLVAYDGFDYTAGEGLVDKNLDDVGGDPQNGGTGWTTPWKRTNSPGNDTIVSPGLTYPGLPVEGNAVAVEDDAYRMFSNSLINTGTLYVSMIGEIDRTQEGFGVRMRNADDFQAINSAFGINRDGEAFISESWKTNELVATNTNGSYGQSVHLLVMKYDFDADVASLYVNPTVGTTEPGTATLTYDFSAAGTYNDTLQAGVSGLGHSSFNNWDPEVDEFRVATTFAEAVGVPEPASLALLGLGGLTMLGRGRRRA